MFKQKHYTDKLQQFFTLRDLCENTKKNYISSIKAYLEWLEKRQILPEEASYEDVRQFLLFLKTERNLKPQTINFYISKIRFFFIFVLERPWSKYQVPFSKFNRVMPEIFSEQEAKHLIETMVDLRLKTMSALLYGSGLRLSEVRHLKYKDINRKEMTIYISPSKSRSDRYAILPPKTLELLTNYWFRYGKPKDWLFPAPTKNRPMDPQMYEHQLRKHCKNIGWTKPASSHLFRHSFATHLYDRGMDLLKIQKALGHKTIHSTTIYVQLGNINKQDIFSPLDWN